MRDMTGEHATPWRFRATHASPLRKPLLFVAARHASPSFDTHAGGCRATHAWPLRKPLLFVAARHASPSFDTHGGGCRATHASPLRKLVNPGVPAAPGAAAG